MSQICFGKRIHGRYYIVTGNLRNVIQFLYGVMMQLKFNFTIITGLIQKLKEINFNILKNNKNMKLLKGAYTNLILTFL